MTQQLIHGACLCGAIHFEVVLPSLWCGHCHCTQCRRYHGAGVVTWVGFAEEKFHLTRGEQSLRWYASSAAAQRGFCGECGSSMLFRSERWPGEIHIALANILDPIDREPEGHTHFATHVDWLPLADELPRKPD
jgi:hypothetical protein